MSARSWAGTTLADRRADRHRRLLDAGLELLGAQGSAAVSVRSVCRAARLTDRYFYESFADREALLLAVYDAVAAEAGAVLVAAVDRATADPEDVARSAVTAFLDLVTEDPRKGRVLLLEPQTDSVLYARGTAVVPLFEDIVRSRLGDADATEARLTATALIGALTNLLVRWLDGALEVSRMVLTEYCVRLLVVSQALAEPVSSPDGAPQG